MATREAARPQNDAYIGLLSISLVALVISCILLYVDYASYPNSRPPVPPTVGRP